MTSAKLIERALRRITPQPPTTVASLRTSLAVLVEDALRLLPIRVKEKLGQADAELYRKDYTVALTSGQGSLSTHTTLTNEPMIPSEIVKVTHPDAITDTNAEGKLQRVGSASVLNLARSLEFSYFAIENNTLYTMKDNDRATLGSNATVRAAFPPLITNVQFSHEMLLVDCLIELSQSVPAVKVA